MATQVVAGVRTSTVDLGDLDNLVVGLNGVVTSDIGDAVTGTGNHQLVRILGSVVADEGAYAVSLGDENDVDTAETVIIGATGFVSSGLYGVRLNAYNSYLSNAGAIHGDTAVLLTGQGSGATTLINTGLIEGAKYGISTSYGLEALHIRNIGTISGSIDAVGGSGLDDTLRNLGHIYGDVFLSLGNDTYDGRGGTIEGTILGGIGDDTFRLGNGIETVDGGVGIDTLDFRKGGAIHVALDGSFANTGAATDDEYSNIENILGSSLGADILAGDGAANALSGLGGNDALMGGLGNDTLTGGRGADKLAGGLGNDWFLFNAVAEGGDKITDYGTTLRDNDTFAFSASGFGAGLVAGLLPAVQFQARADNVAQDADDRFIFNTVLHQLWFDANGNVGGGLTLIATVQAGVVLTAADILIL